MTDYVATRELNLGLDLDSIDEYRLQGLLTIHNLVNKKAEWDSNLAKYHGK